MQVRRPPAGLRWLMLLLCCAGVPEAGAQSWKFVDVIQMADLEYGMVVQQTGEVARSKTDPAVAVFKVYAKLPTSAPQVSILLYPPAALTGPGGATVPYEMTAAYNTSANNPAGATVMNGTSAVITPQIDEGDDGPGPNVRSAYVYVYGSVTVGTQPAGPYTGEITLVAEEGFSEELPTECDAPAWDPAIAYYAEDWVVHAGHAWQARYYTMGNEPGTSTSGPWDDMGPCDGTPLDGIECEAPPWSAFRAYDTDAWATYDGSAWQALYYVQGEVPGSLGSSGAWEEMGPCDGTVWGGTQCDALPWAESRIYNTGDWVTHNGSAWQALYYTRGGEPGVSGAWEEAAPCDGSGPIDWDATECAAPPWLAGHVYDTGEWATYDGSAWRALYYTKGEVPGSLGNNGAWEEMGPCDGSDWNGTGCDTISWTESRIYNTGDRATYVGILWQANWYSRGAEPGVSGAWSNVQSCNGL